MLPPDRVVIVIPPRVLVDMGLIPEGQYWLLSRALYRLRECPRLWAQERDARLKCLKVPLSDKEATLVQSVTDPSLWTVTCDGQVLAKLCTYVDDTLATGPSHVVHAVLNAIGGLWQSSEPTVLEAHDKGRTLRFCGVDVERLADGGLRLHQKRYVQDLLVKWGLGEAKHATTTGDPESFASNTPAESQSVSKDQVQAAQQVAGALNWLATRTRPDIAYGVNRCSSCMTSDPERCISMAKRLLRYLKGTLDYGLIMRPFKDPTAKVSLQAFCDASWAPTGDYSQYGVVLMWDGVPLSWRSSRETLVALNTAEAELYAAAAGLPLALSMSDTLASMGVACDLALMIDNQAALRIATERTTWRTRHFQLRAAAIRDYASRGWITLQYVASKDQTADVLTKHLAAPLLSHAQLLLGLK